MNAGSDTSHRNIQVFWCGRVHYLFLVIYIEEKYSRTMNENRRWLNEWSPNILRIYCSPIPNSKLSNDDIKKFAKVLLR